MVTLEAVLQRKVQTKTTNSSGDNKSLSNVLRNGIIRTWWMSSLAQTDTTVLTMNQKREWINNFCGKFFEIKILLNSLYLFNKTLEFYSWILYSCNLSECNEFVKHMGLKNIEKIRSESDSWEQMQFSSHIIICFWWQSDSAGTVASKVFNRIRHIWRPVLAPDQTRSR